MSNCNFFIDKIYCEKNLIKQIRGRNLEDIKKMIDEDLNYDENCTPTNLSLIIAHKEKVENSISVNALYIALCAFMISFLQAIISLLPDDRGNLPIGFLVIVLIIIFAVISVLGINSYKGIDEKRSFAYSYLISRLEFKIKNKNVENNVIKKELQSSDDSIKMQEFENAINRLENQKLLNKVYKKRK